MTDSSDRRDRVLVVDDDVEVLRLLSIWLGLDGFEVLTADDGDEALYRVIRDAPDIVVLDVMMPRLDGIEVCQQLRSNQKTKAISVIMLSAKVASTDKAEGLRAGADDYVTKPFDPEELIELLRSTLRRNRDRNVEEKLKESFALDRRQGESSQGKSNPPTVLIVDDDGDTREILRLHCEFIGFQVIGEAANGLEAIALARQHLPAFVILDQRMPMLEGHETADQLRLIVPAVTIVAFTAVLEEKPAWADEFLSKYDVAELTPLLGKLLTRESDPSSEGIAAPPA